MHDHLAALPYDKVPKFIASLRASHVEAMTKLALEFMILTAARTKEVQGARWVEVDLVGKMWTIPGADEHGRRMKTGRTHVVPLPARCIEILNAAKQIASNTDIVFPDANTGRTMLEARFRNARDALGYTPKACTPHGFRSSFRDWAAEETPFPSEVVEMALAHSIKSKVEAAYRRGQLLVKRRELMEAWATYATTTSAPQPD